MDQRELAWQKVVICRKPWDRLAMLSLLGLLCYPLAIWLFDIPVNYSTSIIFIALGIGGKYYAQHRIDSLTSDYYKKFPVA